MRVAREGLPFIGVAATLAAAAVWFAVRHPTAASWITVGVVAMVALWVVYFFRDPERFGARGDRLVISPADGRVIQIVDVQEPAFLRGPATRISVFMNIFSVHVNRYPVSGTVRYTQYNPGKFINAAAEKASLENEQMSVGLESAIGRVLVRQIAGLIARRIVTYSRDGDAAVQGERFGIIRFGSRVDVFLPPGCAAKVRVGDRAVAGVTVLAEG
ncbi:MAG TPA: phosphatidylserine decarboxylase family protein [Gemmatimonadaceae bacterium]|nr:phosphatidylserine decarboxylase family protein [Gemmatimonadaceae bacterium]